MNYETFPHRIYCVYSLNLSDIRNRLYNEAEKIIYKEENRIKIDIPCSRDSCSLIQQIAGGRWSRILNAWYIPYTKEAFGQLKSLFPDVEYDKNSIEYKPNQKVTGIQADTGIKDITLHVTEKRIILKLPKNERDIQLIRTMLFSRWIKNSFAGSFLITNKMKRS